MLKFIFFCYFFIYIWWQFILNIVPWGFKDYIKKFLFFLWEFGMFEIIGLLKFKVIVSCECFSDKLILKVILMMKFFHFVIILRKLRWHITLIINSDFQWSMLLNWGDWVSKLLFWNLLHKAIFIFNDKLICNNGFWYVDRLVILILLFVCLDIFLFLLFVLLSNLTEYILHFDFSLFLCLFYLYLF